MKEEFSRLEKLICGEMIVGMPFFGFPYALRLSADMLKEDKTDFPAACYGIFSIIGGPTLCYLGYNYFKEGLSSGDWKKIIVGAIPLVTNLLSLGITALLYLDDQKPEL